MQDIEVDDLKQRVKSQEHQLEIMQRDNTSLKSKKEQAELSLQNVSINFTDNETLLQEQAQKRVHLEQKLSDQVSYMFINFSFLYNNNNHNSISLCFCTLTILVVDVVIVG